jgi:hypothetical protein
MVGFNDNLAKHIDLVNTDSKYVMRFKCSEQPFKTNQPVFIGVVYCSLVLIPQQFKHTIRNKLSLLFTLLYTELFERDATPSFKSESIDIQSFMSEVLFILIIITE